MSISNNIYLCQTDVVVATEFTNLQFKYQHVYSSEKKQTGGMAGHKYQSTIYTKPGVFLWLNNTLPSTMKCKLNLLLWCSQPGTIMPCCSFYDTMMQI